MSDPRRYLDDADAPAAARTMLRSAAGDGLDPARADAIARALGVAAPPSAPRGGKGKWAATGVVLVAACAVTFLATRPPPEPEAPPAAAALVTAAVVLPSPPASDAISVAQLPEAPSEAPAAPMTAPGRAAASAAPADDLPAQLRALEDVRRALAEHRAPDARAGLGSYERTFPRKLLAGEARVLDIETLYAEGRDAEASAKGRTFLVAAPDSPYAARIRSLVEAHGDAR